MATTIKVPVELRDRLAEIARREHTTLAGAIARTLDGADEAAFWRRAAEAMTVAAGGAAAATVEGTLADGLDPDERWDDVL